MRTNPKQRFGLGIGVIFTLSLILSTFIILGGCSQNPIESKTDNYDVTSGFQALSFIDSLGASNAGSSAAAKVGDDWVFVDSAFDIDDVDEEGSELTIQLDGQDVHFIIPEGAVTEEIDISICGWKYSTPFGYAFIYECGPSGQQFNVPIQVIQYAEDDDGDCAGMFYQGDEEDDQWELEQISVIENGNVEFEIHHFSKYGISFLRPRIY